MAGLNSFHYTKSPLGRIDRKTGRMNSAVSAAAYNARARLENEFHNKTDDYTKRSEDVLFHGVFAPKHAPEWMTDSGKLWNNIEWKNKHPRAQLAHTIICALPAELTTEQQIFILKDFVREQFVRRGYVADVALHKPDQRGSDKNFHAHIQVTMRTVNPDGSWSNQERTFSEKGAPPRDDLKIEREAFAKLCNRQLVRNGFEPRFDHRSLIEQGIDRTPTVHVGKNATNMARDGKENDRADILRKQRLAHRLRMEAEKIEQQYANENAERLARANDDAPEIEKPRAATVEAQTAVAQSAIDRMNAEDRAAQIEALRAVGRSRWATMGDELRGIFTAVRSLAATMGGALFQIVKGGGFFQAKAEADYAKSLQAKPQPVQTKPKQPAPAAKAANPTDELKRMGEKQRAKNKQRDEQEALDELRAGISGKVRRKGPEPNL